MARLAGALAVLCLAAGCANYLGAAVPADLDHATTRRSELGAYRVSYRSESAQIPIGRMHSRILHVETADGHAVTDAAAKVDGDMPRHRHGLPTRHRATRKLGNGDYRVEGVQFQMGGWWVMEFTVATSARSDVARFKLMLQG